MSKYQYMHGSTAPTVEYDVYSENKVLKEKKKYRKNRAKKFFITVNVLIFFSLAFLVVYRYALISQLNLQVMEKEKQLSALKAQNARLVVEIEKKQDLEHIRNIASEKLGMKKPDKMQVVYYSVPKYDVTFTSARNQQKEGSFFSRILLLVKN